MSNLPNPANRFLEMTKEKEVNNSTLLNQNLI